MTQALQNLPTLLILGALVVILFSMRRQHPSVQFKLWLQAWVVMFAHFCAEMAQTVAGRDIPFFNFVSDAAILVSGVLFIASVSVALEYRRRLLILAILPSLAFTAYCALSELPGGHVAPLILCLLVATAVGVWHLLYAYQGWTARMLTITALIAAFLLSAESVRRGNLENAFYMVMTVLYIVAGLVFYRRFRRTTIGVMATSIGFLLWGAVPALYKALEGGLYYIPGPSEIWNVPKFIVAIGMVVTLLENQRIETDDSRARVRSVNEQMRRFADLTLQMLSGRDVSTFGLPVVEAIVQVSNYERASLVLVDENQRLHIAAIVGVTPEEREHMERALAETSRAKLEAVCSNTARIGANSFRTRTETLEPYGAVHTRRSYPPNPYWREGDEILVPIRSSNGSLLGMVSLDDPKEVTRVDAEELSAIELLATDIGAALETADLHKRLVRSEKLAGIGQLVGGVAHELNNPLTAVLGYSEMLAERVPDESMKRDLEIMRREALRMKRIIEDLQRFSRQSPVSFEPVPLAAIIDESVKLRKFELHSSGAELSVDINKPLANVRGDAAMLKQVVLNLLNNALDAVRQAPVRRVRIEAGQSGDRIILRVTDSGPGFADISHVFDPFYTTKAPGKGTGLGLSICYGIVKEHEGEISAANLSPSGASITVELPAASAAPHMAATPAH